MKNIKKIMYKNKSNVMAKKSNVYNIDEINIKYRKLYPNYTYISEYN